MSITKIDDHSSIKTNIPIPFSSWNGETVTVAITRLKYQHEQEASCIITFTVPAELMKQLVEQQWFNLLPHTITAQVRFNEIDIIEVRAILSPAITLQIAARNGDVETILAGLLPDAISGTQMADLAKSEYWYVLDAKQSVSLPPVFGQSGMLRQGFQTTWSESLINHVQQLDQVKSTAELDLATQIEACLQANSLKYEYFSDSIIRLRYSSPAGGTWIGLIRIEPEEDLIVLYSVFPEQIPAPLRQGISLQLMGENYDLLNGAFELDQEDGELRFRSSLICSEGWNESSFTMLLNDQIQKMEHYLPVVHQIIHES
ncbi:YbjN domain-containing protein [Paenibacillus paridis]|uniref:YbjN domain-containing protein n=1 Tax=Paenibacillus paridis TaxID=2583376 RepID=UPI00111DCBC9|nr:YbjN domain-containing protein [Paenibacillus paridis]